MQFSSSVRPTTISRGRRSPGELISRCPSVRVLHSLLFRLSSNCPFSTSRPAPWPCITPAEPLTARRSSVSSAVSARIVLLDPFCHSSISASLFPFLRHTTLSPGVDVTIMADSASTFSFPYAGDLMVLETPLLRVSRPVAACSRCRAAKVKCDGKLPACTACEKSGKSAECSSTNDQFARGKERSYVATLEARVEKLEKKIAEAKARRKSSVMMFDADDASTPRKLSVDMLANRPSERQPVSARAARRKEAHNIDNLVSDFGLL